MLLAHRTLHCCFWGEGHIVLIECLQSWADMGKKHLSLLVLRDFLLVPGRRDPLMLTHISHLGTNTLRCGNTKIHFYVLFSLSTLSIDLTPLSPETCWDLYVGYQYVGQSGLSSVTIEMASLKRAAVPFLDCGSTD